jgi:hypothetical protein
MKMIPCKAYTHQQLAVMFFPELSPESASRQLTRWIKRDPELLLALQHMGYGDRHRVYSPKQVEVLFNYLGRPEMPRVNE